MGMDGGLLEGDFEIYIVRSDYDVNAGPLYKYTDNAFSDINPDWSYDGRFIILQSNRGGEPAKAPGGKFEDLMPFYVINVYTSEVVAELGDFANAGYYLSPRFLATEAVMAAVSRTERNNTGEAIISGNDNRTSATGNSHYNYYRETIPAANSIVDAYGSPAYNYGVTSWW